MNLTAQHLEALRKFKPIADAYQAVSALVADQADLNSLQQAHSETENRLNEKRELEKGIDARLDAVKLKEVWVADAISAADTHANEIVAAAELEADKIKDEAQRTGEAILDRIKQANLVIKQQLEADNKAIQAEIEKARDEYTQLADAADRKRAELDSLNADLDKAKEHIQVLLRGKA